jgi:hypothetical protein
MQISLQIPQQLDTIKVCNRASDLEKWLGCQDAAAEMAADRNTTYTYDTHSLSKVAHAQGKYTTKRARVCACVRA